MTSRKRDDYAHIVANEPILTQTDIQEQTKETEYPDEVVVFYSSGDEPKHIPYSKKDQEQFSEAMGETLRILGLNEDDVVLNLGAPEETHHQSGWGLKHGPEAIGATVINNSVKDFDSESSKKQWEDVTAVESLPRMLHALGQQIEEQFGDLQELFPNAEIAITSGDTFPQRLRDTVKDQWGFDAARNFYAATEMGVIAAEDEQDEGMVLTNNNLYIELLDPDVSVDPETKKVPEDAITPIYDVDKPVTGPALFSAPDRELLPFIRYRAGDVLTAYPSETGSRILFEGREDRVINLSGAMVYPREIENAVRNYSEHRGWKNTVAKKVLDIVPEESLRLLPEDIENIVSAYGEATDWKAVVSVEDNYPVLNMYLSDPADEDIVPYLAEENGSIHAWYDSGAIKIRQHSYTSEEELEANLADYDLDVDLLADERKSKYIGFDASYRET